MQLRTPRFVLATFALTLAAPLSRAQAAQQQALVCRSYDLAALAPAGAERTRNEHLLPFLDAAGEINEQASFTDLCNDSLLHLLATIFAPELEVPGRFLRGDESGAILLCAPENVHAVFDDALAQLARQFRNEIEVDVLYASVPSGDAALLPDGGLIAAADVGALATRLQGGSGRALTRTTLRVPAMSDGWFAAARELDALVDFDIEIAQGSHTADPVPLSLSTGLRLGVRAIGDDAGTWLACVARAAEPSGPPTVRRVSIPGRISAVESVARRVRNATGASTVNDTQPGGGLYETDDSYELTQLVASCAGWGVDGYVPAGKALALRTRVALDGAGAEALILLAPHARASRSATLPLIDGSELVVRDVSGWSTPRARRLDALPSTRAAADGFISACGGDHSLSLQLSAEPPPEELVNNEHDGVLGTTSVAGLLLQRQVKGSTPTNFGTRAKPRVAAIELVLTRGAARTALARASCALRAGGNGLVALGRQDLAVRDYDVEVAQGASIADPRASFVFQGLVAELVPHVAQDGALSVLVRTRARVDRAANHAATLAPNSPSTLDLADADLLASEELVRAGNDGAIDARLGTDVGAGLGLELRARLVQ